MPVSRAAVLESSPGDLVLRDVVVDDPAPDEVLVRTVAAGVCHSDLHFMRGVMPHPVPTVLGHEAAGVVEAVGSAVHDLAPGDHVVECLSVFCGRCEFCLSGRPAICTKAGLGRPAGAPPRLRLDDQPITQFLHLSSFSELALVHRNALVRIDDRMPLDVAALLGCGVLTGLGAVFRTAGVRPGETVAVIGCGGVGLSAIHGAELVSAAKIVAVDTDPAKLELAKSFGATDVVDASQVDAVEAVRDLTDGGVHHAFEAVGLARTTQQAFSMARRGGTATVVGMMAPGEQVSISGIELLVEKRLQGSQIGSNQFITDIPRYVDLYLAGKLRLDSLVSRSTGLDGINDAYRRLGEGGVARQLITFGGEPR
ncbi:Zn-dependent alcohol dehydrogenase [Nocardioides daejeonensis]|uniref:Zn-dependent alcohol dehydrogenase n=1 Tax=Nocardioides daejeonensis TaxID=1046556 RepID=UPI000D74A9A5|nr:Zn-dependent alcohol dehydrogenase [Nocardioides daejeonensis]